MTDAERKLVREAVERAEAQTDGEIVTIVAQQSDAYHDVGLHWAVVATFFTIAVAAWWPAVFEQHFIWLLGGWRHDLSISIFLTLFLGHLIAIFLFVRYLLAIPALRMMVTPHHTRTRRVRRRAVTLFRAAVEARTLRRTGILIYLSLREHHAEIVADSAISAKVDPSAWGEAMHAMVHEIRHGRVGAGMAAAVERVGAVLAEHVPRAETNPNELPDRVIEL
jgi:putative membrane protein